MQKSGMSPLAINLQTLIGWRCCRPGT